MFELPWLQDLTAAQRQAVLAADGPLLVLAGAGTGKTRTLACRVARLLADGVAPERVLLLTFTRRAAADLMQRARSMAAAGHPASSHDGVAPAAVAQGRITGGTFHAVANRLLREHGHALGVSPAFTVLDAGDAADLLDLVRTDRGLADSREPDRRHRRRRFPGKQTLADIYSRTVSAGQPLAEVLARHWPWCADDAEAIGHVFSEYTQRKRALGILDYDDLLLYWRALLDAPVIGDRVRGAFDHVLVDEYQDTNVVQCDILRRMGSEHRNVTVVGDDAQAIYSFRAATVENILRFPDHFPGADVVRLEENFRSTAPIIATANAVLAGVRGRWDKTLHTPLAGAQPVLVTSTDEHEQAERICDDVIERREDGVRLRDQAVLMRTGHHSAALEIALRRRQIPFVKFGGLKFLEAAHVKDLVALLRVLDNPSDELAWFRMLQWFDGIGPVGAQRLFSQLTSSGRSPLAQLLDASPVVPPSARDDFAAVCEALGVCSGAAGDVPPVIDQIDRLRVAYAPLCARRFDDAPARLRDLEQLAVMAAHARDRTTFLTDLVLDPPASTGDLAGPPLQDEDWLVLSTIHSAKGLEWDTVHVLGLVDGMIPSDMAAGSDEELDEERRLLYVAVTRARRRLWLHQPLRCYHQRFGTADAYTFAQPSRFLDDAVLATVVRDGADATQSPALAGAPEVATGVSATAKVDAFLAELWG